MPDTPRPAATRDDTEFSLSIEEVASRYAAAGHPRTLRTLQRYCASGHLDSRKAATALGDKYFVTPQSVARHIAQIDELKALELRSTERGLPRPAATADALDVPENEERQDAVGRDGSEPVAAESTPAGATEMPRQNATTDDLRRQGPSEAAIFEHPYVKRLEVQVERLEARYEAQVRRTEEIQMRAQERLMELQRMTTIGQSKTLADFMLQARNWLTAGTVEETPADPPTHTDQDVDNRA